MIVIAIAFVLWPGLTRDRSLNLSQDQLNLEISRAHLMEWEAAFKDGRISEIEFNNLCSEMGNSSHLDPKARSTEQQYPNPFYTSVTLAIFLPIIAGAFYYFIGTPSAVTSVDTTRGLNNFQWDPGSTTIPSTQSMLDQLKEHLSTNPDDTRGWSLLAQGLMSSGNYSGAIEAYEQLLLIGGRQAHILVLYADALAMSAGGSLNGKPTDLLREALTADPLEPIGLWLSGVAAQERGEYKQALGYWYQLKPMFEEHPDALGDLENVIKHAEQLILSGDIERDRQTFSNSEKMNAKEPEAIKISISINPSLASELGGNDVLFVYASARGIARPIAVTRHRVSQWPVELILDDSSSMLPGTSLFTFDSVAIGAHISRSRDAIVQPGDLTAERIRVTLPAQEIVQIELSRILP
jgi:cytochrome c-type biogenesis protein CcmH